MNAALRACPRSVPRYWCPTTRRCQELFHAGPNTLSNRSPKTPELAQEGRSLGPQRVEAFLGQVPYPLPSDAVVRRMNSCALLIRLNGPLRRRRGAVAIARRNGKSPSTIGSSRVTAPKWAVAQTRSRTVADAQQPFAPVGFGRVHSRTG